MSSDYIPRLRAELLRAWAAQQRSSRWASVGRPQLPALDRLRPSPHTLAALAAVLALVAVLLAVAWESDLERPAAPPGASKLMRARTSVPRACGPGLNSTKPALSMSAPSTDVQAMRRLGMSSVMAESHSAVPPGLGQRRV